MYLAEPWEYHAQEPNIPCGESLTSMSVRMEVVGKELRRKVGKKLHKKLRKEVEKKMGKEVQRVVGKALKMKLARGWGSKDGEAPEDFT